MSISSTSGRYIQTKRGGIRRITCSFWLSPYFTLDKISNGLRHNQLVVKDRIRFSFSAQAAVLCAIPSGP